jgi:mono/diheme cytochrome c family protein
MRLDRRRFFLTNRKLGRRLTLVALGSLALGGCTDAAGYDLDRFFGNFPVFSTLRTSVAYQPHTLPRLPAEGAVPTSSPLGDGTAAFTQTQLDSVGAVLTNPVASSPEVLARGRLVYERQCSVCHGATGDGAGTVVGPDRFPAAIAINGAATAARSDGYLYGVIRVGRGLMPSYGERVADADRWAVVHYVRQLQGGTVTPPSAATPGVSPVPDPATTADPAAPPAADTAAPVTGQ